MNAFESATHFFHACEAPKGWSTCKQYATKDAIFNAQCEPLVDIHRVEDYCEWMAGFAGVTAPGGSYDLHSASYNEESRTALFFATYHARHTGEGGPVPPTQKQTHSHYVMAMTMNKDNKVEKMIKIWNAPWAMKELGWM